MNLRRHSATLRRLSTSLMATARPVFPNDAPEIRLCACRTERPNIGGETMANIRTRIFAFSALVALIAGLSCDAANAAKPDGNYFEDSPLCWHGRRDCGPAPLLAAPLGPLPMRAVAANRQRPTSLSRGCRTPDDVGGSERPSGESE